MIVLTGILLIALPIAFNAAFAALAARFDEDASPARREAVDIVFQAFHRYLGVAVGEHLGYLLSGAWTVLSGIAIMTSGVVSGWVGVAGVAIGALLMVCAFEFVGAFEDRGWRLAGVITPSVYIAWSLWLVSTGVALLIAAADAPGT
jgi:hypothetical protein